jgi:glucose-1-phosphate cytidylyltransferase
MKAVILCGGFGTRLGGAGGDLPKPMVSIGGRPILWHIMKGFAHRGYHDFVLCLGYRSDVIKQYFLNLSVMVDDVTLEVGSGKPPVFRDRPSEMDWTITLAETGDDSQTGHRVKRAAPFIPAGDDCFILTYGDGVSDVDMRDVVRFHRSHGKLATVTAVHPPGRFGELEIGPGGCVEAFNEKPQASAGWISGGFFVLSRAVLDRLSDDPRLMLEREPLQQLSQEGELIAYRHEGFWYCLDTPRDYHRLGELWGSRHAPWAVWQHDGKGAP